MARSSMDLGMIVLARGRKPLNMGMLVSVAIGAAFIILTNGILCVFLLRDKKLWKIVSSNMGRETRNLKDIF